MWISEDAAGVTAADNDIPRGSRSPTNIVESRLVFLAAVALLAYLTVRVILTPRPGQLLTLKGVFRQPLARISRQVTDKGSATKTRASQPRTFAQVLNWGTFCSDAIIRFEALDDKIRKYSPQVYNQDASGPQTLLSAADEVEVRGYLFGFLQLLSQRAPSCGLRFEYIGAGSYRNFCFTDLLLRERRTTDIACLSALNWGIIEVKGPWQLSFPENMSLAEAIAHPDYQNEVLPAVQQAYGDAVAEEAPVFAITNYEVTVFCHRNLADVTDRRIWASPPIPWNNISLPPRAAWLHFMAVAQSCQDLRSKDMLLRNQVPVSPLSGYSLKPTREELSPRPKANTRHGHQRQGMRQQPARRAKAHAAKSVGTSGSSCQMQTSSALLDDENTGYLSPSDSIGHCDLSAAACCTQDKLARWLQRLPAGPFADFADAISELCWISFDNPTLTMECLGSNAVVRVMKAHQGADMLVMKAFNAHDEAAVHMFVNELKAFNALSELQGQIVPSLHSFGQMVHTGCLATITHWAGCNITNCNRLSLPVLETAKQGLQAMHNLHVSHGDIHPRNMLLHESKIMFCDLGRSTVDASSDAYEEDLSMLDKVVQAIQIV